MSKIAIKGNESGTATFTIEAPATNTDRIFELPDEAGKVLTDASDIAADKLTGDIAADRMKDGFNASGSAPIYACRAWVNFNGTASSGGANRVIRASGNVSSVTRNGTGDYTVNFATAMPDANYSTVASGVRNIGDSGANVAFPTNQISSSAVRLICSRGTNAFGVQDFVIVCVSIFR